MTDDIEKTIKPEGNTGMQEPATVGDSAEQTLDTDRTMHIDAMPKAAPAAEPDYARTMHIDALSVSATDASTERTLRPSNTVTTTRVPKSDKKTFFLKGDTYEMVKCLSESSGEAQVFLVTKDDEEFVLKVYYPNFDINKKLMQVVRSFQFEMIVELFDYGKTYVDGKHRYYELMEYLKGGTLRDLHLEGDFNRFRRLALQAAAALAYCHYNGVLHKDIKPTNFFFRDEEQTQLVLGDFGISALQEGNSKTFHTTQARTPIYAAPEMYADVIDGVVEITAAADFYSLGMTLFAAWLGENPMSSNERIMMRQKSEGHLPRLNELPDNVKRIIQGLTAVNQQTRWGYNEVERWFQGEDVAADISSPFLRYKSFIVDPDRNIVAENVHELVPLLAEREQLGINYLYNGRIVTWLENSGNAKLSELLKDIITNRYPVDKHAGLTCALYTLDPTYPYVDIDGTKCDDVHSVALSLLSNQEKYGMLLRNPHDRLFLWLDTHVKCDVDRLRSYFTEDADSHVAVLRLVYEVDPEIPFLSRHPSSSVKEIIHSFGYSNPTEEDWYSLCDGRLLSWMYSHEDLMACESLRILTQGQTYSKQLAYKVLYNLDRSAAFDLREASTPQGIGEQLAHQLMQTEHLDAADFEKQMQDYVDPQGRFFYFAQLHGWYDLMNEANRCFDLTLPENRDRLSAYDLRTGLYRFCRILGTNPTYLFPNGTIVDDCHSLSSNANSMIRSELRNGSLAQWMSVFYHEDPNKDFAEEYSYERALEEWILALGRLDNQQMYYKRFTKACEDTKNRVASVRKQWQSAVRRENIWKYTFYGLCGLWAVLVLLVGITGRSYIMEHKFLSIGLPLGGMSAIIVAVHAYFKGIGSFISALLGVAGAFTAWIPIALLTLVQENSPGLFNYAVVGITAVYMLICHLTAYRRERTADSATVNQLLKSEDIKSSLLEPLYYTFKTKSQRYKSTKFGVLDEVSDQVRSLSGESVLHYVLWSVMVMVFILMFCIFSRNLIDARLPFSQDGSVTENVDLRVNNL